MKTGPRLFVCIAAFGAMTPFSTAQYPTTNPLFSERVSQGAYASPKAGAAAMASISARQEIPVVEQASISAALGRRDP